MARSNKTYVQLAPPQFGSGHQLVVGADAKLSTHVLSLRDLPHDRYCEVVAMVVAVGPQSFTRDGNPYRRLMIMDESLWSAVSKR